MSFLRLSAVAAVVLAVTGLCYDSAPRVDAVGINPFADLDQDMVPDCIELVARTDPNRCDTDGDGIDDFEEILTFTSHDNQLKTRPVGHGMRVIVTSTPNSTGGSDVYMHLLLRFVNVKLQQVTILDFYADLKGTKYPILPLLGYGPVRVSTRERKRDGTSFLFSMRLSSEKDLLRILPCTIGVRALIGGKLINTGTFMMRSGTDIGALMPFTVDTLILQPVNSTAYDIDDGSSYHHGYGRVCEMSLSTIGHSSGGILCEVDWATCRSATGLRCSSSCTKKTGSTVVIPDGLGTITGGG